LFDVRFKPPADEIEGARRERNATDVIGPVPAVTI
jgi:hypothetical protein